MLLRTSIRLTLFKSNAALTEKKKLILYKHYKTYAPGLGV